MILIDKPYLSDFLIDTIKKFNFEIIDTVQARNMISDNSLNWISESNAIKAFNKNTNIPIYTNSENTIAWIEKNFKSLSLQENIHVFKNKILFRELVKDMNPNYFFKGIKFKDLKSIDTASLQFPLILKPAVGFFSIAVYKVDNEREWHQFLNQIDNDINNVQETYPKEVINTSDFIIEQYITGKEYAIDCYFNEKGEPVVLNILHHIFSSEKDVSDRIYSTSKSIVQEYYDEISEFLKTLGSKTNLKNFPAHVEVRIDDKRKVHPIEVNPLRFGGWCTTGDFTNFAYGINSYDYFLNAKTPNWDNVFKTRKDKKYSIIVLDNNSGLKETEIDYFDYEKLLEDFEKPLDLRKVDYRISSVFGFLFTETSKGNEKELTHILNSNLRKYIKTKTH